MYSLNSRAVMALARPANSVLRMDSSALIGFSLRISYREGYHTTDIVERAFSFRSLDERRLSRAVRPGPGERGPWPLRTRCETALVAGAAGGAGHVGDRRET